LQQQMFRRLHPEIEAALLRMAVPLVACDSLLAQIIEQDERGYLCLSKAGSVVELNARASVLLRGYVRAACIEDGRGWLDRFIARMLAETAGRRTWQLERPDGRASLGIRAHRLLKDVHAVPEPLTLVELQETEATCSELRWGDVHLSAKQREVACQLVMTGRSQKEMAAELRIAVRTLYKHVDHVYRAYRVRSRSELVARLR
jgi:DNA-binding CsgD family transcriptional regulator